MTARKKVSAGHRKANAGKNTGRKSNTGKSATTSTRVSLTGNLDIDEVRKLHARLCKCADKNLDVNINAANVSLADTAGLQLLLSFINTVTGSGNNIKWQSASEALHMAADKAGIHERLGLDAA